MRFMLVLRGDFFPWWFYHRCYPWLFRLVLNSEISFKRVENIFTNSLKTSRPCKMMNTLNLIQFISHDTHLNVRSLESVHVNLSLSLSLSLSCSGQLLSALVYMFSLPVWKGFRGLNQWDFDVNCGCNDFILFQGFL